MIKQSTLVGFAIALIVMLADGSLADIPHRISFQGKLYDHSGNPLEGEYEVSFRIYNVEGEGTALWSETVIVNCNNGLYTVILGQTTALNLDFDNQYWLGVQVTGDDEMSPRYRLVSVPTAFRAQVANRVSWTNLTDVPAGFADGEDDVGGAGGISQINEGSGITVTNPTGPTATVAADIGTGTGQVAAGDHNHDTDYVDEDQENSITGAMIVDGTVQEADLGFTPGGDNDWTIVDSDIYHETGKVGIGTTTPAHRLDVFGTVRATNNSGDGIGVRGHAVYDGTTGDSVANFGGYFTAEGIEGIAVYGHAPYTQGGSVNPSNQKTNYGGYFQADGLKGIGVYGRATVYTGNNRNYGGYFQSDGAYGVGVYGEGTRSDGIGVMGIALNYGDYGGYFKAEGGSDATGVKGIGSRKGGSFTGTGEYGYGVEASGEYYGLYSSSSSGTAGYFYSHSGLGLIVSKGNVGIGTENPNSELTITATGESKTQGNLTRLLTYGGINIETEYTANAYTPGIFWSTSNNHPSKPKAGIYLKESSSGTSMYFGTSNNYSIGITNDALLLQYNGYVGIGTTSPGYKLDVNGTIRGNNVSPSDIRLKKEIVSIENALEKVASLRGTYFRWVDNEKSADLQMGVIAQEVESVFPEAVSTDDEGYKSVAYGRLIAPLIEAVKELKAENEKLREEIDELKSVMYE